MVNSATVVGPPVDYRPDFLDAAESADWLRRSRDLAWERGVFNMYGRPVAVPRDEALYGDDLAYRYRGEALKALPWPDFLLDARERILRISGFELNFAVGNRYRTGRDSIGWHSDDFPQIGRRPPVASLSLGGTRRFKLKHKLTGAAFDYDLPAGSLLIMLPGCQDEWMHAVPKTSCAVAERINWTFRPHMGADARPQAALAQSSPVP